MPKTITVRAEVRVPGIPNFLRYDGDCIDIADVNEADLRAIGAAWTEELVQAAAKRRQQIQNLGRAF